MDIGQDMLNNSVLAKHLFGFSTLKSKVMPDEQMFYVYPIPTPSQTWIYQKGGRGGVKFLSLHFAGKKLPVKFASINSTIEFC